MELITDLRPVFSRTMQFNLHSKCFSFTLLISWKERGKESRKRKNKKEGVYNDYIMYLYLESYGPLWEY